MNKHFAEPKIKTIPIQNINILNPRVRSQKTFQKIVENIERVGLKRPITVTLANSAEAPSEYDLVCGQGRIEAFIALGQSHIPAIIVNDTEEKALLKSLIENCARRLHRPIEHFMAIKSLQEKGYDTKTIATKIGLSVSYTKILLNLLDRGEDRLLIAVESGIVPLKIAALIANSPDDEQSTLQQAYEQNNLSGRQLRKLQKLLALRRLHGKSVRPDKNQHPPTLKRHQISSQDLMKVYNAEVDRKKRIVRKADQAQSQLLFIMEGLRALHTEKRFLEILEAENLSTMPKQVADLLRKN